MEKFNQQLYRDDLAKEIKEVRQGDPEKAREILGEAKETEAYKSAESKYRMLREWDQEAQKRFEENATVIDQMNAEAAQPGNSFEIDSSDKIESFVEVLNEQKKYRCSIDYYRTDYPGEVTYQQEFYHKNRLLFEKLGFPQEERKIKEVEEIKDILDSHILIPHDVFPRIEFLAVFGLSGELMNDLKSAVIKSGNANILRKLLEEFPISFSQEELNAALKSASDKNSLFDITKIIEMTGENNVDPVFVDQRESLLQKTREKFVENRKSIEQGVENRDFLLHFSGNSNLDSILEHGILSNLDQLDRFGKSRSGQGNDLQRLTGRLECVSVYDVFKGANLGEKDLQLALEMQQQIESRVDEFLRDKYEYNPRRIFDFVNPLLQRFINGRETPVSFYGKAADAEAFKEKYSETVSIFDTSEERIDPSEKNPDGGYYSLEINYTYDKTTISYYNNNTDSKQFTESFFKEWTTDKQELMSFIKKLMKETYIESNKDKENKKDNIKNFEFQLKSWIIRDNKSAFIINPTMERTFVNSLYVGESMVEGSVSSDKILGAFVNNAHLERVCYNEGMVVIDYKKKEELSDEQRANILFETPNGAIIIKDLYK